MGIFCIQRLALKTDRISTPWAQMVLPGELPSRGRSIQAGSAGSLCYNNGCAVEVVAQLTPLQHLQPKGCALWAKGQTIAEALNRRRLSWTQTSIFASGLSPDYQIPASLFASSFRTR
jgi:hypothetical protein